MRRKRPRLELGMKLHADEPRVPGAFDDLREHTVGRHAAEAHAVLLQPPLVSGVDLVAMAVTLRNFRRVVYLRHLAAAIEHRRIGAEPHRPAEIAVRLALL